MNEPIDASGNEWSERNLALLY